MPHLSAHTRHRPAAIWTCAQFACRDRFSTLFRFIIISIRHKSHSSYQSHYIPSFFPRQSSHALAISGGTNPPGRASTSVIACPTASRSAPRANAAIPTARRASRDRAHTRCAHRTSSNSPPVKESFKTLLSASGLAVVFGVGGRDKVTFSTGSAQNVGQPGGAFGFSRLPFRPAAEFCVCTRRRGFSRARFRTKQRGGVYHHAAVWAF